MQVDKFTKYDKEKEEKYNNYKKIIKEYSDYSQSQLFNKKFICIELLERKKTI